MHWLVDLATEITKSTEVAPVPNLRGSNLQLKPRSHDAPAFMRPEEVTCLDRAGTQLPVLRAGGSVRKLPA